ncbi:MAG: DUF4810 domain-containing protein [Gemmatimonadetes bacterium]|nr:MAG: DUF4810 domain-containing protein [Candidatus Rokubacteria bacterium]PYP65253.1 MAG: DUF4810 domain-containing protein [Gemmatimonadota bacterium]
MSRLVWLLALFGLVSGCATPTLYSWGHYEELVYVSYAQPGKVSPEMQVEKLEEDYQKARANNKRMHPGFHAHLGYLYFQLGKVDQALQEFATEKAEFPESTVFMDRLISNLKR